MEYEILKTKHLTLDNVDNINFIDPIDMIASHATKLLWGQGYAVKVLTDDDQINEPDTEKLNDLLKNVGFQDLVLMNEWGLSAYGRMVLTIDKSAAGLINIGIGDPNYYNQVGRIYFANQQTAVVWKKFVYDNTQFRVKETWTTKDVKREFWFGEQQITLFEFAEAVPKEYYLPEVEVHNLGILPVHEFLNLRKPIFTPQTYLYSSLSDWHSVKHLQMGINANIKAKFSELFLNSTRIFGNFPATVLKNMKKQGVSASMAALRKTFIQATSSSPKGDGNKLVEILQADPKLDAYDISREKDLKLMFNAAGYTYMSGEETLNTNASTLFSKGKDIETTKFKRAIRQREYEEFIKKLMVVNGMIPKENWKNAKIVFEINENIVQSPEGIIDAQLQLVNAGMITKAQALKKILDLSLDSEAEAMVEQAEQELNARQEQEMQMINELNPPENQGGDAATQTNITD